MNVNTSREINDLFTAETIARCIECRPQYVRKLLKHVPQDGPVTTRGVPTAAWSFSSLPSPLIERLVKAARNHGYKTPVHLLQNPPVRGARPRSIKDVSPKQLSSIQKLMQVFGSFAHLSPGATDSERARLAAPEYLRIFGHRVSDRYLRRKIAEVRENAGGNLNFNRIEFFLPGNAARDRCRTRLNANFEFREFDEALRTIRDLSAPTLSEVAYCWREILRMIDDRLASGADEIKLKRELRKYVVRVAPFLGATKEAVKRAINRKLRQAIDGGGIGEIRDGRIEPKARPDLEKQFESDIKLCAKHATFFSHKKESQAYRQLHEGTTHNGERFSEEFRGAYPFDVRRHKSQMPKWFRAAARAMVRAMWPRRLGPHAARLALPSIHRDWSNVFAGDYYTSDDETLNHLVIDWNDEGKFEFNSRRFDVIRPQFLPVFDERTECPLGFSLLPAKTYSAWTIRTLMARIAMRPEIGLPFLGWLFERGVWSARNVEALASWTQIDEEFGRRGISLRVLHATTPKAKIVEGIIGRRQNLDEYAPGYIGRDPRVTFEREHKFLQSLKRVGQPRKAEVDPGEAFLTIDEFEEVLADVMQRFATEPQNGERLHGRSPQDAWKEFSNGRAHVVLPDSLRFLLAASESIQTVTTEGIKLRIGGLARYYCGSERLGELLGEKVRVRYNPELPEHVVVSHIATDPRGLKPFSVPLFERLPAHGATRDQFDRAREHQNRFAAYGRARYRELAPSSNLTISNSRIGSSELRAAGEAHNRLEGEHIELRTQRNRHRAIIREHGLDPSRAKRPDRVVKHLQSADELEARITELEHGPVREDRVK